MHVTPRHMIAVKMLLLIVLATPFASNAAGFTAVSDADWDEAAVRQRVRQFPGR